ncbi:MAG: hypothetical protein ACYCPT_12195 [Acidimicrobiales bacterium]
MELNIYLIVFIFIILVAIVLLVQDLVVAMLIISLLTNFLTICINMHVLTVKSMPAPITDLLEKPKKDVVESFTDKSDPAVYDGTLYDREQPIDEQGTKYPASLYGDAYANYEKQKTPCYKKAKPFFGDENDTDAGMTYYTRRSTRDKQAIDGYVSKTADFYKYYYDDQFNEDQNSEWWGQYEY